MEGLLEMNTKERERLKILIRLQSRTLTQKLAAQQLKISIRQVQRLHKRYREGGEQSIVSAKRGKKSNRKLTDDFRKKIAEIIIENYHDFGPTLALEKLNEIHNIKISITSVRNIMIESGIWKSRKLKQTKNYQRRAPRDCIGELLQIDGSYHDWFEGRCPECCLLVLIDDATSRLMWMQFVKWESCFGYFNAIKAYIKKYGKPLSIYTDRLAVFETTRKTEKNYKDTQFHRAMSSLGINLILANSPQAKGRVERVNETLQDRLVKEMRLARISTMEEGNAFLPSYIESHNKKFAKIAKSPINAHKTVEANFNPERILSLHYERKITKDLMIYFKGKNYQIVEYQDKYRLGGQKVLIIEKENGDIEFIHKDKNLKFKGYQDLPKESKTREVKIESIVCVDQAIKYSNGGSPSRHHPWKIWRGGKAVNY
jgi:transposase